MLVTVVVVPIDAIMIAPIVALALESEAGSPVETVVVAIAAIVVPGRIIRENRRIPPAVLRMPQEFPWRQAP
jgi:hypothetical protein